MITILSIERIWEDDYFYEIKVHAKSEFVSASTECYTNNDLINNLANNLSSFPKNFEDRFFWENGEKGDDSTTYFSLEFWCEDKLGHILIEIYMEINDGGSFDKHNCCFYLKTEIGLLNNFGKSLFKLNNKGIGYKVTL